MALDVFLACVDDAQAITDLAFRSKAYWGYTADFMAAVRAQLAVSPQYIQTCPVFVAKNGPHLVGFYSLRALSREDIELDFLFVEPDAIGTGVGKRLFGHAVTQARELGYQRMVIEADPFAEGFYTAMGAVRIGERRSTVLADRVLPLLSVALTSET